MLKSEFVILNFVAYFPFAVFAQPGETANLSEVDVHPSAPNSIMEMRVRSGHGRYELRNATLVDLIRTAWKVDADNVTGGPDWLDTDRFDVIATVPENSTPENLQSMLKGLLKDHFRLLVHGDTKNRSAYAITVGKKSAMEPASGSEESGCVAQAAKPVTFVCRSMTMAAFAKTLPRIRETSGYLFNYPVLDRTGLQGAWNFSFHWSPRRALLPTPLRAETITIFDAFEKQLGLKLNMIQVPIPVVVVDSANKKPTANLPGVTEKLSPQLEFEVAVIKPDAQLLEGASVRIELGGTVRINMSLQGLIEEAWGELKPHRIVDGPKLMDTTRWAIVAKAPVEQDAIAGWNGPVWNGVDVDSMRMMLRALLVDRFKLAAHYEDRMVSGYALVASRPKLGKADPANRAGCKEGPGADGNDPRLANPLASRLVTCRNMTITQFAGKLSILLFGDAPVIDSTGISGRYDMTINFTPPSAFAKAVGTNAGGDAVASEPNGAISIFEALSKLGLKLQSRKVMASVLVIDHVNEVPTEN